MADECEMALSLKDEKLETAASVCGEALGERMLTAGARAMIDQI
jgi:hypothetical protein